jgi:hypothetical protein
VVFDPNVLPTLTICPLRLQRPVYVLSSTIAKTFSDLGMALPQSGPIRLCIEASRLASICMNLAGPDACASGPAARTRLLRQYPDGTSARIQDI